MTTTAASVPAIAQLDLVILDCPDPRQLAAFYGRLLGWSVTYEDENIVSLRAAPGAPGVGLAFQLARDFTPPSWPSNTVPQQSHLDLTVTDLDDAESVALAAGARKTGMPAQADASFRVYLDPAGHPFCLVRAG